MLRLERDAILISDDIFIPGDEASLGDRNLTSEVYREFWADLIAEGFTPFIGSLSNGAGHGNADKRDFHIAVEVEL